MTDTVTRAAPSATRDARFEIKAFAADGAFEGYASVFGIEDDMHDVVAPGAFRDSLTRHRTAGRMPALLWQHDGSEPIGVWEDIREDERGLYVRGRLFVEDIPRARQAHALLKGGGLSGLSIGFHTVEAQIDEHTGLRTLTGIDLLEVSLVTFPALEPARVTHVKRTRPGVRALERALRDAGLSRAQAKAVLARGHGALASTQPIGWSNPRTCDDGRLAARIFRAADAIANEPRT